MAIDLDALELKTKSGNAISVERVYLETAELTVLITDARLLGEVRNFIVARVIGERSRICMCTPGVYKCVRCAGRELVAKLDVHVGAA